MEGGAVLNDASQLPHHRIVTDAVHKEGQNRPANSAYGRYSYQPKLVAPSAIQAPSTASNRTPSATTRS
jgi:2,4-dienoyl-CoA reductase (NADPH2)